jgi:iron-sulfur cluster repair protein YtfE (RIC family)
MPSLMQALRDEHAGLAPQIEQLRLAADRLTSQSAAFTLRGTLDETIAFLRDHLIPHAFAEDEVLYPAVDLAMGCAGVTTTMSRDHIEVVRHTEALEALRGALFAPGPSTPQILEARRLLYGLYALISVHLAKEEEFYIPLLEASLSEAEASALYAAMERAAERARAREAEAEVAEKVGALR